MSSAEFDFDYVIIGSGFGGSVSALRLAEKGYRVCVIERGKRFAPKDFARTNWDLKRYLWMPTFKFFGIQNLSLFRNVLILSGSGVGGGSLVYANTLLEPGDAFYTASNWSHLANWKQELAPHYLTAKKMLGVTRNPQLTEVDDRLKEIATEMGRASTFKSVDVAIYFGDARAIAANESASLRPIPDPFFGGKGPARVPCNFCGACMVGCRFGSKNTLDKNYLYLAESLGVEIRAETAVENVSPIGERGEGGYEVDTQCSTAWFDKKRKKIKAKNVIFAAGVLGTVDLLLRCKFVTKSLTNISDRLGMDVRTNSEALIGVTTRDRSKDFSKGIAITSGFYPDENTHIEPVRYPSGSSFMKFLAAPMADDGSRLTRPLKMVLASLLHPIDFLRLLFNRRWAESTIILLVMQSLDNKMRFKLGRHLFTFFRKKMVTASMVEGAKSQTIPSYIAIGHVVARLLAKKINGIPQSAINEVALQIPTTAHILGGCGIGQDKESGVIDKDHKVFGYENLYVCDGSVIPANLGVNPSLTITAMTERCMSKIKSKGV